MNDASLVLVGSGIKFLAHLTNEARAYIEQSDKVLYLVNDPAMKDWIQQVNPRAESLDELYQKFPKRLDCYQAITDYILTVVRQGKHVCVVLYGHPSVFSKPGLDAIKQAKQEGIYAKILPGISAEDCLFADLLIDPGSCGCQSFETTDFLIHQRQFDASAHLILWQVDIIGVETNPETHSNQVGASLLVNYLQKHYPLEHAVVLYEAAQYPGLEPRIVQLSLHDLPQASFSRITTLYVPPARQAILDMSTLAALQIDLVQ